MLSVVLAVLLQAAPVPTQVDRDELEQNITKLEEQLELLETVISVKLREYAEKPQTGILVDASAEDPDAILVTEVLPDGPAALAGMAVGDRIVAIDKRVLDTETVGVIRHLLDERPGTVTVTYERNGESRSAVIERAPLTCLIRTWESLDRPHWDGQIAKMREGAKLLRTMLADEKLPVQQRTIQGHEFLHVLQVSLVRVLGQFQVELDQTTRRVCNTP